MSPLQTMLYIACGGIKIKLAPFSVKKLHLHFSVPKIKSVPSQVAVKLFLESNAINVVMWLQSSVIQ